CRSGSTHAEFSCSTKMRGSDIGLSRVWSKGYGARVLAVEGETLGEQITPNSSIVRSKRLLRNWPQREYAAHLSHAREGWAMDRAAKHSHNGAHSNDLPFGACHDGG